jgi:16S rRNA (guanine(966)-N(2))-methyltransferase RsmD
MLDRQKQRLFDILGSRVEVEGVYDLFAGSGGLGLEALSRGAGRATFVEQHPAAVACLRANIAACRFEAQAHVVVADALRFDFARARHDASLVFADPPFPFLADRRRELARLLATLAATPRVIPGAILVWRIPAKAENVAVPEAFDEFDRRAAGTSVILLYAKKAP